MSKFTPGPGDINKHLDITYKDRYVALVCFHLVGDVPDWSIKQQEEAKSNARLIAAAPEMYELLRHLFEDEVGKYETREDIERRYWELKARIDGEVEYE